MHIYNSTFASATPLSPDFNFAAGFDDWQKEPLPEHAPKTNKDWAKARAYRKLCEKFEPLEAARLYLDAYPDHAPDAFHTTGYQRKAKAKAALQPSGWATRLLAQLDHPSTPAYFYSLHMGHLGLPIDYADPRFRFYPLVIEEIKEKIAAKIPAPYHWKAEVGKDGALHVHLIAARPPPQLAPLAHEGSKVIQRIRPGTEARLLAYLSKPTAPFTAANYANYLHAKQHNQATRLPNLSGLVGVPRQPKKQS